MIYAHFDDAAKQIEARAYNVYQYDWGQRLQVTGLESLELPNHTEVHFAIEGEETAITRVATVSNGILTVDVPFKCLQYAKKITAYIYVVNEDDDGGQTKKQVIFTPRGRAKPDDDVTPDEERVVDTMVRELNAATEQAQIDVTGAKEAATAAAASKEAAAKSQTTAAASEAAAAASQQKAAESEKNVSDNTAAVQQMYNNLTINIDGGDALNVDTHVIDGGTAETTP
jgi:hypothetical protein